MDTRFWGPSGWRLLHMVTFAAPDIAKQPTPPLRAFLKNLPYVLPCKYCRASLSDYFFADQIPLYTAEMSEWMYRIHNRVNGKLREQKLLDAANPQWPEIRKRYTEWLSAPCTARRMVGWDFLFSIAHTTPLKKGRTTPMPGAPLMAAIPTPALRNRWNVMTAEERFSYLEAWWGSLGGVLPFQEWRTAWAAAQRDLGAAPIRRGRKAMVRWLFAVERAVCTHLKESIPHNSFEGLCSELATFTSGCGKSKRSKTCRATKGRARTTLKQRRRATYRLLGGYL